MAEIDRSTLFDLLRRIGDGMVSVIGPHCEVVVIDFSDLERSVVSVSGNVTGRQAGAPVPDLDFTPAKLAPDAPDVLNYRSARGAQVLNSSTIMIRDEEGAIIGAVGINVDHSRLVQVRELLDQLAEPITAVADVTISDTFAKDLDELLELSVAGFLRQEGLSAVGEMSRDDRLRLMQLFQERGLFQIRGVVNRIARLLDISRATVYNLRAEIADDSAPVGDV